MKKMPRMARGRRNRFFAADGVDELMSMVLELTAELSVLRERQYATERVLEAHDIDAGAEIENWMPSADDEARMAAERERLLANVMRTLEAEPKSAPDEFASAERIARDKRHQAA